MPRPPVRAAATAVLGALQQLVLPVPCTGCGTIGPALCPACRAVLVPAPVVRALGPPTLRVWSGLAYDGVARSVLLAFKNEGRTELAPPLAVALLSAVDAAVTALGDAGLPDLVPMPRTVRSSRDRGYEPVRVVLRRAGLPSVRLLRLVRNGADQTALGRSERRRNAEGSMRSLPPGTRPVLLVDDVVTTGATLLEAARAVREAGGEVLGAVTVASTPERAVRDGGGAQGKQETNRG